MSLTKEERGNLPVLQMPEDKPDGMKPNYSHITGKAEKYVLVKAYLETPFNERQSLPVFRRENKIRRDVFLQLKQEIEERDKDIRKQRVTDAQKWIEHSISGRSESLACPPGAIGLEDDPMLWWKARQLELNQAILASATSGNAQSQKLAKQLAGELVERQEIKIGLTAEERARRLFQAQEELKKEGYGTSGTG